MKQKKLAFIIVIMALLAISICGCNDSGSKKLEGKTILMPLCENFYGAEYKNLSNQLKDKGATIIVASDIDGEVKSDIETNSVEVDILFSDIKASDYDAVVVIGGWHYGSLNASDELRDFISEVNESEKVIAGICNGTRFLGVAGILKDKTITCRLDEDLLAEFENFGATPIYKYQAMTDGNIVTAQGYEEDWDPFITEIVKAITSNKEE